MATPAAEETAPLGTDATASELEATIERARENLGRTVDALSEKLDVKAAAKRRMQRLQRRAVQGSQAARARGTEVVSRARAAATDDAGTVKPAVPTTAALVVAVVAVPVVVWWMRR